MIDFKTLIHILFVTWFISGCASGDQKKYNGPKSINIPISKFKVKIKNAELNFLNKRVDVGFEQMYLEEGQGLRYFKINSKKLKKELKVLAYLKPTEIYDGLGIRIPISEDSKIDCYFNATKDQRKAITDQTIDFFATRGYKIYLNINNAKKNNSYKEYILYKISGVKKTFGMFISKFVNYRTKSGKTMGLFCAHDGAGMRNTVSTLMRIISKQF